MTDEADLAPVRRRRRDAGHVRTMSTVMAGLHEGIDLRAEQTDVGWYTESKMRDVGALASPPISTGLHEYHPDGVWTPIGTFRTLRLAEVARDMLREGTHLVHGAHNETCGEANLKIPARLVTFAEAHELMIAYGLVEPPETISEDHPGPRPR